MYQNSVQLELFKHRKRRRKLGPHLGIPRCVNPAGAAATCLCLGGFHGFGIRLDKFRSMQILPVGSSRKAPNSPVLSDRRTPVQLLFLVRGYRGYPSFWRNPWASCLKRLHMKHTKIKGLIFPILKWGYPQIINFNGFFHHSIHFGVPPFKETPIHLAELAMVSDDSPTFSIIPVTLRREVAT